MGNEEPENHKHCAVCGKVVFYRRSEPGKTYVCSEPCSKTYDRRVKKVKAMKLFWFLSPFIVLIPLLILIILYGL